MILVSASSTARTTARHSGSENPSFAASSPKAFRTTHSIAGSLRNSILSSKLPRLTRALSSGQRNRIPRLVSEQSPLADFLAKRQPTMIHGIPPAATCELPRRPGALQDFNGIGIESGFPYAHETVEEHSRRLVLKSKKLADEPVSRILCRTQTGNRLACAAIIPLVPVSLPGSSSLPEGSHPRWLAPPRMERVHFHERSLIEPGRLSPPIWPCTARGFPCPRCHHRSGGLLPHLFTLAKRCEHFEDVSQVSLCDATALHSAGGLFSVALSVAQPHRDGLNPAPHAEACNSAFRQTLRGKPPGVTRRVALSRVPLLTSEERASGRCPDFPPAQPSSDDQASNHPARPPNSL